MHLLPILTLAALSSASSLRTRHVLHQAPLGWTPVAPAPANHLVDMRIGLKQARMGELLATLGEISDPRHERYGMHLSKDEVEELVAPRKESVESVERWLSAYGVNVTGRSAAGDWIHARVPVKRAEKMLNTRYNLYRHASGTHLVRSESYALPRSLDDHIDLVVPTTFFGKAHEDPGQEIGKRASTLFPVDKNTASSPGCNSTITPDCLTDLYNIRGYTPSNQSSIGIAGYLEQYPNSNDLNKFYKNYQPDVKGATLKVETVHGGLDSQLPPGTEANLDVQYASVLTHPISMIYYSTGGRPTEFKPDGNTLMNTNEPYLDWLDYLLKKDTLPATISTSYGDDEQTVPPEYAVKVCNGLAALGARGASVLFSSGDSGVGGGQCLSNDGSQKKQFLPTFPASCPYVTSVGATYAISPEIAVDFSQGGFSNYFARPSYQASVVDTFLAKLGDQYDGLYNKTGRGFPDVSAQGQNYQVVIAGITQGVSGTSASCPTFAGVIALLNDYRLAQGKPPLGFLNPWLYNNAGVLNDITAGSNPGCGTQGFNATVGWDPVTGLGTPDFQKMKTVV